MASGPRWTFDADGAAFKLASEARRIQLAHLFDPYAGVASSTIRPLPHQIEAVYNRLLPLQPLRFLLADVPGAGRHHVRLFIREPMLRGDLDRCLIVAPGSIVEQWQEELDEQVRNEVSAMGRTLVEESRTGNPFIEREPADRTTRSTVQRRRPPSEVRVSRIGTSWSLTKHTRCRHIFTATRSHGRCASRSVNCCVITPAICCC